MDRCLLEQHFLIILDVVALALGKAVHEEGTSCCVIKNDGAKASRLASARPCHPLLDYASTEISVNLTLLRSFNGFKQGFIRDAPLTGEAFEPCVLEYPHK